ncbi:hypothetical protein LshimejAT787_0903280 [Lyophyllum shimeji]|uniref:Uncharacterized protein n=1 Tax=Lyophyllum shimeji TaxID=47721 RepID=A0A9P3PS93_LYOSH|nr:hypothetical protein LshimejAT787_0903280 [Lyophyllum shimeji]
MSRSKNARAARLYSVRNVAIVVEGGGEGGAVTTGMAPLSEISVEYVTSVSVLVADGIEAEPELVVAGGKEELRLSVFCGHCRRLPLFVFWPQVLLENQDTRRDFLNWRLAFTIGHTTLNDNEIWAEPSVGDLRNNTLYTSNLIG